MAPEAEKVEKAIVLTRVRSTDTTTVCEACTEAAPSSAAHVLIITLPYNSLVLCPKHEIDLLSILLNNYVRRRNRNKTALVLRKEEAEGNYE